MVKEPIFYTMMRRPAETATGAAALKIAIRTHPRITPAHPVGTHHP
jgi:hypothetical protein